MKEGKDIGKLIAAIGLHQPIWPNSWDQDTAALAFVIHELRTERDALQTKLAALQHKYDEVTNSDPRDAELMVVRGTLVKLRAAGNSAADAAVQLIDERLARIREGKP